MNTETTQSNRKTFKVPASLSEYWMELAEACSVLSLSRWTVAELVEKGVLERKQYGKFILIGRESVQQYLLLEPETPAEDGSRKSFEVPAALKAHWFSLAEACKALSVSRWTISDLCSKGVLERKTYGKFILIGRKSVDAYLKAFIPSSR